MIVAPNVFPRVETVKILVRSLCKKRRFRTRFESQHVKASQKLAKSPWEPFCHVVSSFSENLIPKISPLILLEVLAVFVNRLTANGKYPVQDSGNFQLPIQMQWSQKRNIYVPFLQSTSNFKHFEKNDGCHNWFISEIRDCENLA